MSHFRAGCVCNVDDVRAIASVISMITDISHTQSSSSFNLSNRHNDKVTVYKSNISRSLRHRKAVHSTNTRPYS